ncbi:retrovirus-related pol polyprotein from transposon TNT 1-94 [Tanacetum coccineum]
MSYAWSQAKDTIIRKLKDRIKSLSGKENVENVKKDIDEIETLNIELEHSVAKLLSENENLRKEREHLKSIYKDQFDSIRKTRVQSKEQSASLIVQINAKSNENSDLNAQLQEKVFAIAALKNKLKKLKGKNVVNTAELLVYVSKTCPSLTKTCEKLDAVTPINKAKKVRFAEHVTSSSNNPKENNSFKPKDSNKPLLTCTGVKPTTSASGSKPSRNTKNNRITRPPSSNQKNKVEEHPRKVKSSLNRMNSVYEPNSNALVKHSVRNAKFESICVICNKCLFDANHDMCIIDYVNDANVRSKSKSKRNKKRKVWKPMGKVYSRKPKASRSVGSSSKAKIVESKSTNTKEPKQSWGSTVYDVPSFSLIDCSKFLGTVRFGNDHIAKIMGYTIKWETFTISRALKSYYEEVRISHQTSVALTLQQNGVIKRQNHTLVEAACTMLIFLKAPLFLWAEAVATACYTQNRSLIRKRHNSTPYELLHDRKLDLSYLYVFGALCYPTNDNEDLVPVVIAPEPVVSTSTPSSTIIDQDAPPISTSQTTLETPSPVIPLSVEEADHDI